MRNVYIIGVGNTACGRFPEKPAHILAREAAWAAIKRFGDSRQRNRNCVLRSCLPGNGSRAESS